MRNLLSADLYRMTRTKWLRLYALFMVATAIMMVAIQRTAMDYTVKLDRVIFLPMAFYGIAAAAFSGMFVGEDFSGGTIKNKLLAGPSRDAVYQSSLISCLLGCIAVYLLTVAVTLILGVCLFPVNVAAGTIAMYVALGLFTCLAYGSIFCMLTLLIGNRNAAAITCMLLAFAMLFLCLHSNQVLMQKANEIGLSNPASITGTKRVFYEFIHDLNPSGQAAQLSAMRCINAVRFIIIDLLWVCICAFGGAFIFRKKDVR